MHVPSNIIPAKGEFEFKGRHEIVPAKFNLPPKKVSTTTANQSDLLQRMLKFEQDSLIQSLDKSDENS